MNSFTLCSSANSVIVERSSVDLTVLLSRSSSIIMEPSLDRRALRLELSEQKQCAVREA